MRRSEDGAHGGIPENAGRGGRPARPGGAGLPGDQGQGPGGGAAEEEKRTGPGGCMPVSGPGDRHGLGHGRFRRAGPAAGGKRGTVDPLLSGGGRDGPPGGRDGGDPGRHLYQPQLYRGLPADRPKRRRGGGNASLLLEADPGRGGPEGVPLLLLCGAQPEWAGSGRKPRLGGSAGGREAGEHLSGLYRQRGGGHESGGRPQAPSLLFQGGGRGPLCR